MEITLNRIGNDIALKLTLKEYLELHKKTVKPPRHWKADIVNQIIELIGLNPAYAKYDKATQYKKTYVQWLSMIKRSRKGWGDMMSVLKNASGLPDKYNKAGYIINQLKPVKTQKLL